MGRERQSTPSAADLPSDRCPRSRPLARVDATNQHHVAIHVWESAHGDLQSGAGVPLMQFSILEQPAVCIFERSDDSYRAFCQGRLVLMAEPVITITTAFS